MSYVYAVRPINNYQYKMQQYYYMENSHIGKKRICFRLIQSIMALTTMTEWLIFSIILSTGFSSRYTKNIITLWIRLLSFMKINTSQTTMARYDLIKLPISPMAVVWLAIVIIANQKAYILRLTFYRDLGIRLSQIAPFWQHALLTHSGVLFYNYVKNPPYFFLFHEEVISSLNGLNIK